MTTTDGGYARTEQREEGQTMNVWWSVSREDLAWCCTWCILHHTEKIRVHVVVVGFFFFFFQKAQQSRRTNDGKRMRSVPFIISWQLAVRCLIGFHRRLWLAFRKSQTPPILVLSPDRCIWEHLRFVWPNFVVKCCSSSKLRVLLTQTKATCPLSTVPVDNAGREWSTVKKLRSS